MKYSTKSRKKPISSKKAKSTHKNKKSHNNQKPHKLHDILEYLKNKDYGKIDTIYQLNEPYIEVLINKNQSPINLDLSHTKNNEISDSKLKNTITSFDVNNNKRKELINQLKYQNIHGLAHATMGVAHNLSTFMNYQYFKNKKEQSLNNAYLKLWEIYHHFLPEIMNNIYKHNSNPLIFHIAEFPGNWIKTTLHYTKLFYPLFKYDWRANSLNPNNDKIKKEFGEVFKDEFGYLRDYPNKWLFGSDDTGDILKIDNIKNMASYFKNNGDKLLLITGDAGLRVEEDNKLLLQKIEVGQLVMSLACLAKGGSTIMKHFLTPDDQEINIIKSISFTLNLIYTYYLYFQKVILIKPKTSNPNSSEYYLVGINFKGITETQLDQLYQYLQTMQLNDCIYPENKIDLTIKNKIFTFMNKEFSTMATNKMIQNFIMICSNKKMVNSLELTKLPCFKLDNNFKNKKLSIIYNQWMKKHRFNIDKILKL